MKIKDIFSKTKLTLDRHGIWAVLILAGWLRFTELVKRDFWYDEAFTGIVVRESFAKMMEMLMNDVHPPLYYLSLKLFALFFNYNVFSLRLFSAIFGFASVVLVYLLAKRLFGKKAALYSSFISAISPLAIQYSQEARMYSMLVFFILIATYFFVLALETGKKKFFAGWGIFMGLSALIHYLGIIFLVLYYPAFLLWRLYSQECENYDFWKNAKKIWQLILPSRNFILGYLIAFIVFLPWLGKFIYHLSVKGENLSWVKPASIGDFSSMIQMYLLGTPLGEWSSGMPEPNRLNRIESDTIQVLITIIFTAALIYTWKRVPKNKILFVLNFSIGLLLLTYLLALAFPKQQYFVVRYLLQGAFFIFIFAGLILSQLKKSIAIFFIALYLVLISQILPLENSKGYNSMINHLDKYENNNFYILNPFDYVITKYYLGDDRLTLFNYDDPQYNPDYWAAIGKGLKRTENFEKLKNDPNALIISSKHLVSNQHFSADELVLFEQYENILIYKFQK